MQPEYSVSYFSNPYNHIEDRGPTGGEWEEWDITKPLTTGGNKTVRYTKLEIEMPNWLDQLAHEHPAPGSPPIVAASAVPKPQPEPVQPTKAARKGTTGLLNKLGKLFGGRSH